MTYCTPLQLADGPGALSELAELYEIAPALLRATLAGDDRSDWSAEEIAAADAALASLQGALARATGEVDARLAVRGYPLPADPVQFPVLVVWTAAIARYRVHRQRDRTTEASGRIERDLCDAQLALEAVASGRLSLGAGDPLAAASPGAPQFVSRPSRMRDLSDLAP